MTEKRICRSSMSFPETPTPRTSPSPIQMVKWKWKSLGGVQLFVTPRTVDYQAPLSMEFSRLEYCSGEPFPSPGDLPKAGTEPRSPALQADSSPSELMVKVRTKHPASTSTLPPGTCFASGTQAHPENGKGITPVLTHLHLNTCNNLSIVRLSF